MTNVAFENGRSLELRESGERFRDVGETGKNLVKGYEGLRLTAAIGSRGYWCVGYGNTSHAKEGMTITEKEADELLEKDLQEIADFIDDIVKPRLNRNEFDAIVSFIANIGRDQFVKSDLLRHLNSNKFIEAAQEFDNWICADVDNKVSIWGGLQRRRAAEKSLFLMPVTAALVVPTSDLEPLHTVERNIFRRGRSSSRDDDKQKSLQFRFVHYPFVIISLLLNWSALASLSDSYVEWSSFFQNIIDVYRTFSQTILYPIFGWLPFNVPNFIYDVVILYGASNLIANINSLLIEGRSYIYGNIDRATSWGIFVYRTVLLPFLYIFSPILAFMEAMKVKKTTNHTFFTIFRSSIVYNHVIGWSILVVGFILILFINYQLDGGA